MSTSDPPTRFPFAATVQKYRIVLSLVIHAALFALALFSAFGMYFNFRAFNRWFWPFFVPMLPIVLILKLFVFTKMRLLLRGWRYFGMRDLIAVIKATWLTTAGFILVSFAIEYYYQIFGDRGDSFLFVYLRDEAGKLVFVRDEAGTLLLDKAGELIRQVKYQFPQSAFVLDWGLTIAAVCGVRVLARLYMEETRPVASGGLTQCLIVGAGDTGEALLREILRMSVERYRVIGFLDDDPTRQGVRIHDVPVLGRTDQARTVCEEHDIKEILIADRKLRQKALRRIVEQCEGTHVRFQTIPAMEEVIAGRVRVSQVREVDIKDILGRAQVQLDEPGLQTFLHGKRVFVTGAGGSIGSEICRQVSSFRPSCLILIEQAENNLFQIDRELERLAPDVPRVRAIADICDAARIDRLFAEHEPDVVFHAAAHKHVPMMEWNVGEAIKNNIKGTKTVADAAKRHNTGRFVMISTDKAVNPTSVMGCTKRVTEMYIQQLRQEAETQFMTVRFGNVLGSSGSVVPIFTRQIAAGGPVTVTHPDMTRYFMTIPEATQLVLQAGVIGTDGDIFVLDMGEPVKIVDLAREMITLSGLRPGEDIEIELTGIRPGEKLFEELSVRGEDMSPTRHEQIYIWRNRAEDWHRIRRAVDDIIDLADRATPDALRARLAAIVPEYVGNFHGEAATDVPPVQAESGAATIAPSAKD
ncbi:MAG: polysaccharide biosynthesis protein [Phycisphaerae bacterium]